MARKTGFEKAVVAMLDDNEQILTGDAGLSENGLYTIDARSSLGVISANITGLAPAVTKIYGSDQNVDVVQQGSGNVKCTLAANDIPSEILYRLAGMKQDATSGAYYQDTATKPVKAALLLMSHNRQGLPIYFALYKGSFGPEEVQLNTNTEQPQLKTDSIVFDALNRFSDKRIFGTYAVDPSGKTKDEGTVFADVFPGYKASIGK